MSARPDNLEDFPQNPPQNPPQAPEPLKIALVDDHELLLGGLALALCEEPEIGEVAKYHDPATLIDELSNGGSFDLVVTDLLMGEKNGLSLAQELQSRFQIPVLLMTGVDAPPSPYELERQGIKGLVHKSAPIEAMAEAIVAVHSGKPYHLFPEGWDPAKDALKFGRQRGETGQGMQGAQGTRGAQGALGAGDAPLSQRQIEVLKLVAAGAANKEIAKGLDISENTVKTHLRHIFNALGVTKRTACVQAAKLQGLLE